MKSDAWLDVNASRSYGCESEAVTPGEAVRTPIIEVAAVPPVEGTHRAAGRLCIRLRAWVPASTSPRAKDRGRSAMNCTCKNVPGPQQRS